MRLRYAVALMPSRGTSKPRPVKLRRVPHAVESDREVVVDVGLHAVERELNRRTPRRSCANQLREPCSGDFYAENPGFDAIGAGAAWRYTVRALLACRERTL